MNDNLVGQMAFASLISFAMWIPLYLCASFLFNIYLH